MNRPTHITLPKRWSRAKRKLIRARVMAAQWRAWYWQEVTAALKENLDAIWSGEMERSFDWGASGFQPMTREELDMEITPRYIDDAELLR